MRLNDRRESHDSIGNKFRGRSCAFCKSGLRKAPCSPSVEANDGTSTWCTSSLPTSHSNTTAVNDLISFTSERQGRVADGQQPQQLTRPAKHLENSVA